VRENQRLIMSATGQSLSALEFLSGEYGEALAARLTADLHGLAQEGRLPREALLYDGASPALLDELDRRDLPFAVLTYGEPANQLFKLALYRQLTGRDERRLPAVVTDEPKKGEWIHAHWYDGSDEHMRVPAEFTHAHPIMAKRVVVLDDKLTNLASPDKVVQGIHIDNRPEAPLGRHSLGDVVTALQTGQPLAELARHFGSAA